MLQTQEKAGFRVLARDMAHELSATDLEQVSGADDGGCKVTVTVTHGPQGNDETVTVTCPL